MQPSSRVLTRRGWTLVGAALGLLAAGRMLGTQELWVLATATIVLLASSAAWTRSRRYELVARRVLRPSRLHVGADGRADVALANQSERTTPLLTVTDLFDDGRRAARFVLPPLPPSETARAAYRVPTARRGRYRVGPLTVAVTDPFGLARRSWVVAGTTDVLVCPRVHDILAPEQRGGRLVASVEPVQARAQAADGEEFLTLREYEVGDDLRRVHWRSTARIGELMIRQDEAQWRARAVVVLDVRPAAHDAASFEIAVEATASVVDCLTRLRRRVEVLTSAGHALGSARSGPGSEVIDQLATIEPGGPDGLGGVLTALRTRRRSAFVVAVVGSIEERELGALGALTSHGTVVVVATGPEAVAGPSGRGLLVVDARRTPFPLAWNEAITQWHLAGPPRSSRLHSPR